MQHLTEAEYYTHKQNILKSIVTRLGCNKNVLNSIVKIGLKSRRRAEFKIAVNKGKIALGFYAAKSHNVVDIDICPVTENAITALIPELRTSIGSLKKPGNINAIQTTLVSNGIDICIITKTPSNNNDIKNWITFCQQQKTNNPILRLTEKTENTEIKTHYTAQEPTITFNDINVILPTQPFLQATQKGEHAITKLVARQLQNCSHIADLYSGCGTYTFPLIQQGSHVSAYEGNYDMVTAINNAALHHKLQHKLTATPRDLIKHPLKPHELNTYNGIVINPPRNGAAPQIKQIAKSNVSTIVMVSCNPNTAECDAKYLIDAGYQLTSATAIDQFYQTKHLEVVLTFTYNKQ